MNILGEATTNEPAVAFLALALFCFALQNINLQNKSHRSCFVGSGMVGENAKCGVSD